MATGELLSDDDIDAMLRDLLHDAPASRDWTEDQRARLLADVSGRARSAASVRSDIGSDATVVVTGPSHARRRDQRRMVVGLAAAAVVALGVLATLRLSSDQRPESPAATDASVAGPISMPPITSVTAISAGWPDLLPVISPEFGETVVAGIGQVDSDNPMNTSALLAQVNGASIADIVRVSAVETDPYKSFLNRFYGTPTEASVDGSPVWLYEPVEGAPSAAPYAVVDQSDGLSIVVYGSDPLGFLATAGIDFARPDRGTGGVTNDLALIIDRMPDGYSMIVEPEPLQRGMLLPGLSLSDANGGLDVSLQVTSGPAALDGGYAVLGSITRTANGKYWMDDERLGSRLAWQIGDDEWIVLSGLGSRDAPVSLEQALAIAERIEYVDANTWLARYPEATGGTPATTVAPQDTNFAPAGALILDQLPAGLADAKGYTYVGTAVGSGPPFQATTWVQRWYTTTMDRPEVEPHLKLATAPAIPELTVEIPPSGVDATQVAVSGGNGWLYDDPASDGRVVAFTRDNTMFVLTGYQLNDVQLLSAADHAVLTDDGNLGAVIEPGGLPAGLVERAAGILSEGGFTPFETLQHPNASVRWFHPRADGGPPSDRGPMLWLEWEREDPTLLPIHRLEYASVTDTTVHDVPAFVVTNDVPDYYLGVVWSENGFTYTLGTWGLDPEAVVAAANQLRPATDAEWNALETEPN